jgi:hypothetical protein
VSGDGALNNALFAGVILAVVGSVESLATASGLAIYAEKSRGVALKIQLNKELTDPEIEDITAFLNGLTGEFPKIEMPRLPIYANKAFKAE